MILFLPQEPLPNRYSADWRDIFNYAMIEQNLDATTIAPDWVGPEQGPANWTTLYDSHIYRLEQLTQVIQHISANDEPVTIFLHEGWFPGIEILAMIRTLAKKPIKIVAMMHGGTYDDYDYLTLSGFRTIGSKVESLAFACYDQILVASYHHANMIANEHPSVVEKIEVVDWPIMPPVDIAPGTKERLVVWPHRIAPEKAPEQFDQIASLVLAHDEFKDVKFVKTLEVCKTRDQYFDLLKRATVSVSTAYQETFGISMVESVQHGCVPIVPMRCNYSEMYSEQYSYSSIHDAAAMVMHHLRHPEPPPVFQHVGRLNWLKEFLS